MLKPDWLTEENEKILDNMSDANRQSVFDAMKMDQSVLLQKLELVKREVKFYQERHDLLNKQIKHLTDQKEECINKVSPLLEEWREISEILLMIETVQCIKEGI